MHLLTGVDILIAWTNGHVAVGEHFFDSVIGFFGIAKVVDQTSDQNPITIVECVDANASNVGIDPTGFGHQFITDIVDFLTDFYKGMEAGKDLIDTGLVEDREIRIV